MRNFLTAVWLLLSISISAECSVVLAPQSVIGEVLTLPLRAAPQRFDVTGIIVVDEGSPNGCVAMSALVQGKIAYISEDGCSPYRKAANAQSAGAIALIIGRSSIDGAVGMIAWTYDGEPQPPVSIPCVELGEDDHDRLKEVIKTDNVTINLTPGENQYSKLPLVVFTGAMLPFSVANIAGATYKLVLFLRAVDFTFAPPMTILGLEIAGNLIRGIWCIDPFYSHKLFNRMANTILYSLGVPFTLAATFLVAYYWQEALRVNQMPNVVRSIQKLKIPSIVVIVILFVVEIVTDVWRGSWKTSTALLYATTFLYLFFAISISIFFLVTGIKLIRSLRSQARLGAHKANRIKLMLGLISVSSFAFVAFFVALVVLPFLSNDSAAFDMAIWLTIYCAMNILSLSSILIISVPSQKEESDKDIFQSPYSKLLQDEYVDESEFQVKA
eukprot:TRINITY_DN4332_c0_g1_i4.p1 TRINITY_DN4332_c0_g1~~TRINITY_DN4332_c0_g1_i4.p1  ORF type:complete len:442 (-),score=93.43 TRINITY_DN4332_c0_g1_i4:85-1410(-)